MRDTFAAVAYGAIAVMLTIMLAWAWYCEYANTPVRYTTIQTVDEGGLNTTAWSRPTRRTWHLTAPIRTIENQARSIQEELGRHLAALPDDFDDPKTLKARMDLRRAYNAATDIVELTMRLRLERLV